MKIVPKYNGENLVVCLQDAKWRVLQFPILTVDQMISQSFPKVEKSCGEVQGIQDGGRS